ncbi:hypothetical protein DXG03_008470 [Asterophora parasitica]|uniref:Uncharacterized protein n=1 Tax=Asterophora parasitica TaxID=117018 RepID=A0A9P7GBX7_9AGAR|nr:hypothetical protein DXG03_008470 [Asterophora parasitica]
MTVWKAFTIRRRNGGPNSRLIQTFLREGKIARQIVAPVTIISSLVVQILDLRERGSETVSHSEGTGIAAFTTKSMTQQQCSPFTPPAHRNKSVGVFGGRHTRGMNTVNSNIMLSTIGSLHPDIDLEMEQDVVEMEAIRLGMGMDLGSLSTAVGGDDGEPIAEGDSQVGTPAPAYAPSSTYHSLEMGFRGGGLSRPSIDDSGIRGIRVDVEKSTSTI